LLRIFVFLLLSFSVAQARVFDFGKEKFGTYLRGTYQPYATGTDPFANSSGALTTRFGSQYDYLPAYEFGFLYRASRLIWKFGFELIQPAPMKGNTGMNNPGTKFFDFTTEMSTYIPKIGLEYSIKQWTVSRLYFGAEFGPATMTLQNNYTMTSSGTAAYPGVTDFREEVKGTGNSIAAMLGFETLMSDTTTMNFDIGYRSLIIGDQMHNVAVQSFQGVVARDAPAMTNTGTKRSLDLSSYYVGFSLRIWVY
jgi:hypothetical protein